VIFAQMSFDKLVKFYATSEQVFFFVRSSLSLLASLLRNLS
jgi:hypothetical protein